MDFILCSISECLDFFGFSAYFTLDFNSFINFLFCLLDSTDFLFLFGCFWDGSSSESDLIHFLFFSASDDKGLSVSDNKELSVSDNEELCASDNEELSTSDNEELSASNS